jgi:hypothetical protein
MGGSEKRRRSQRHPDRRTADRLMRLVLALEKSLSRKNGGTVRDPRNGPPRLAYGILRKLRPCPVSGRKSRSQ